MQLAGWEKQVDLFGGQGVACIEFGKVEAYGLYCVDQGR